MNKTPEQDAYERGRRDERADVLAYIKQIKIIPGVNDDFWWYLYHLGEERHVGSLARVSDGLRERIANAMERPFLASVALEVMEKHGRKRKRK